MKKINNKGFVLAETLIVTVFVLTLFSMIYKNYYPIIGLYEEREVYDDVDGKYVAYWVKKLIESNNFIYESPDGSHNYEKNNATYFMNKYGYLRFQCKDIDTSDGESSISMCKSLLNALEVSNCDKNGNGCDVFITHYRIGSTSGTSVTPDFKETVNNENMKMYEEEFTATGAPFDRTCKKESNRNACRRKYFKQCCESMGIPGDKLTDTTVSIDANDEIQVTGLTTSEKTLANKCKKKTDSKVFPTALVDYINYLPDFSTAGSGAKYRVIVVVHHKKALNNYYSFSTMEVRKWQ